MTKKSPAREARDEAERQAADPNSFQNSFWQHLEDMYGAQKAALENAAHQVSILYSAEGLKEEMARTNCKEIVIAMRGLSDDYKRLLSALEAIFAKHKDQDKTDCREEHTVTALELLGEYQGWNENFIGAVMPNVEYLIAEINLVLNRRRAQVAANVLTAAKAEVEKATEASPA